MSDKKILIVDYDQNSLDTLAGLFKPYDLQIFTASDGQMAHEIFRKEKPNCVVLEAMLPKLHGFDLTQKIYEESKGRTPVIIVTGLYKGPQYRKEALRSFGAADYFEKPYDRNKLVNSVMNLLQDELEINEELPPPEQVITLLNELIQPKKKEKGKGNST
ncbi:MAG: response regulator [Acidobacteriota bacterium]